MAVRLEKSWIPLRGETVSELPGQLGVYEIADAAGAVIYVGYAGGRSRYGLRGELTAQLEQRGSERAQFRYEVNMQYLTRYQELLMAHRADRGELPADNRDHTTPHLGRLSPH